MKRINEKLVNNKKNYLKCTSKPCYMSQKILDNNLIAIYKSKITLKFYKPAYIEMCILHLSKILMYEFNYDCIKKNQ